MNAPSGVKASATMGGPIVIEHFGLPSSAKAFQMNMAPSSPPEASSRSSAEGADGKGCHAKAVTAST